MFRVDVYGELNGSVRTFEAEEVYLGTGSEGATMPAGRTGSVLFVNKNVAAVRIEPLTPTTEESVGAEEAADWAAKMTQKMVEAWNRALA